MLRSLSLKAAVIAVALPVISLCPPSWGGGSSAVSTSALAQPVSTQISTASHPVSNANFNAPAFQDVVFVQVTKTAMVASSCSWKWLVPYPSIRPWRHLATIKFAWVWNFDLDPTYVSSRVTLTLSPLVPAEFSLFVSWDGAAFAGAAIDRRPLLTGGEAIITPVTFSIAGTIVQADLPYTLIGAVPTSFGWFAGTGAWSGPFGSSEGHHLVDIAVFNP